MTDTEDTHASELIYMHRQKLHSLSGASRIVGNDESAVVQQLSEYVLTTSFFDCTTCKSELHNSYSVNDQSSKVQ